MRPPNQSSVWRSCQLPLLVACLLTAVSLPATCAQAPPPPPGDTLLAGLTGLLNSPVYSTVVQAVLYANLTGPIRTLADTTGLTLFAPTNAAFQNLGNGILTCLINQPDVPLLTAILEYHVIKGVYNASTLEAQAPLSLEAVTGQDLNFTIQGSSLLVNTINITSPDAIQLPGSAVVHGIPAVLVPPGGLAALVTLCSNTGNLTGGHPLPPGSAPSAAGATAPVNGGGAMPAVSFWMHGLPLLSLALGVSRLLI